MRSKIEMAINSMNVEFEIENLLFPVFVFYTLMFVFSGIMHRTSIFSYYKHRNLVSQLQDEINIANQSKCLTSFSGLT